MSLALTSAMALAMVMPTMKTPWADIAPDASRLSDASGAKTVLTLCTGGTLGTAMQEAGGAGFLSHVSYVSDDDGCPLFPLSDSQAASNLRDADAATFLAHDTASVALLGNVQSYDASELTPYQLNVASKSTGLSKEALAASAWHRLVPQRVHYADPRLGVESWVAATEYAEATPNPLAATNSELLRKLSSKQAELNLFASLLEGVPSDELLSSEVRPRLAWATHKHCPFPFPCPCPPPPPHLSALLSRQWASHPRRLATAGARRRPARLRPARGDGGQRGGGRRCAAHRLQAAATKPGGGALILCEALPGVLGAL